MNRAENGEAPGEAEEGPTTAEEHRDTYAIVGKLVMLSNAIDHQLNRVLIAVLDLRGSIMIEPAVATLDQRQKIQMLKEHAKYIGSHHWKRAIVKYCATVETVFRRRNIACHTPAALEDGVWKMKPVALAKMLKKLDLQSKKPEHFPMEDLRAAITTGEEALSSGENLIENFERANTERARRFPATAAPAAPPSD